MADVLVRSVPDYDSPALAPAVEEILAACGLDALVTPSSRVLLKVNLLMKARPQEAVTTHPAVVAAVIASLKKRGVRDIVIADSPSGTFSLSRLRGIYEAAGLAALGGNGVTLNEDLTSAPRVVAGFGTLDFLNAVTGADVVINLAKLKTHAMMGLTLAVKNCFGVIPGLKKSQQHFRYADREGFAAMVCTVCREVAPAISLVDGVTGMQGNGPSGGDPRDFGLIAGGTNPFLLDRALCHMLGAPLERAHTVLASVKAGLAPADIADISVAGDLERMETPFTDLVLPGSRGPRDFDPVPRRLQPLIRGLFRFTESRPAVRTPDCIGCGNCAEICPMQVITLQEKKARIHRKNCIRCFCCHEVCPARAIDIKKGLL